MKVSQGDILWIDLNPAKGSEIKKKRPCVVVSNHNYNHFFNTAIVLPISSSKKYYLESKYKDSPFFVSVNGKNVQGTIMLQHLRALNISARSNGKVVDHLDQHKVELIAKRLKLFF